MCPLVESLDEARIVAVRECLVFAEVGSRVLGGDHCNGTGSYHKTIVVTQPSCWHHATAGTNAQRQVAMVLPAPPMNARTTVWKLTLDASLFLVERSGPVALTKLAGIVPHAPRRSHRLRKRPGGSWSARLARATHSKHRMNPPQKPKHAQCCFRVRMRFHKVLCPCCVPTFGTSGSLL